MRLCRCGRPIEARRATLLDIFTCFACGEAEAEIERIAKSKRIAPDANKGGYSYQGDAATARRNILQAGKKTATIISDQIIDCGPPPQPSHATRERFRRRQIGVYYIGKDCFVWFEGVNPESKGATRWTRTDGLKQ